MIEFFTETLSLGGIATTKKIKFFYDENVLHNTRS